MSMTPEFRRAFQRVIEDSRIDPRGADLVAVGVQREDCLLLLEDMLEDERITPEWLSILVQWSVAIGVWLERDRWQ